MVHADGIGHQHRHRAGRNGGAVPARVAPRTGRTGGAVPAQVAAPANGGYSSPTDGYNSPNDGGIFGSGYQSDDANFGNQYSASAQLDNYGSGLDTYGADDAAAGDANIAMLEKAVGVIKYILQLSAVFQNQFY